ncbi:MAG: Lrp/AsnC family transcriptional regulator [Christensenellales bacterium]|jgi:DNA-binding Lrp family transcriptional regulator|nr:Lrp/AsnC family transcriptional regulator [Clostridiales bacterium]
MTPLQEKLLPILEEDCRTPLDVLAVMVGDTPERVKEAIEQLEKDQVILRYRPLVNWDKTGRTFVEAMIDVKVTPQRDKGFDAIAKRIVCYPEVKNVYLMSGAYDLIVLVEAPTLKELALFVSEKLSVLDSVTATSTSFVLKRYKQEGVIFDELKEDRRLLVTP